VKNSERQVCTGVGHITVNTDLYGIFGWIIIVWYLRVNNDAGYIVLVYSLGHTAGHTT